MNIVSSFQFLVISLFISLYIKAMEQTPNDFLDTTFGDNGVVTTNFGMNSGTVNKVVSSIHVRMQPDGKILMVGDAYKDFTSKPKGVSCALARYNRDGSLDTHFGFGGTIMLSLGQGNADTFGIDCVVQKDGKIIVVVRIFDRKDGFGNAALIRVHYNGNLDSSFGSEGMVKEKLGKNWSNYFKAVLQDDGKIVAVGNQGFKEGIDALDTLYCSFFISRYNSNGTPDISFGQNGKVQTIVQVTDRPKPRVAGKEGDEALGAVLQSDGKIVTVGLSDDCTSFGDLAKAESVSSDSALVRYDSQGKPDTSFGTDKNGMVITSASKHCNFFVDVIVQPDGKILALGTARNTTTQKGEFLLVRYNLDGTLDTTFGKDRTGIVLTPVGTDHAFAKNIALQKDGKILVTGSVQWDKYKKFTLVRYTSEGILDTTFGPAKDGILVTSLGNGDDRSFAIAVQEDGKMVVAGDSFNGRCFDFALVRYNVL